MKITVLTSDHHNWLLQGFFHQWNKYGRDTNGRQSGYDIQVAGFTRPAFLSTTIPFYSIGKFEDYPVERWSDAVIRYLRHFDYPLVLIMLEDYWLMRPLNHSALITAWMFCEAHPEVGRFDVAADRMFSREARYVGSYGALDLCEAKGNYSLSLQASIYRVDCLLEMLKPGETPWQAELNGSDRLNRSKWKVLGSYQWPMNYFIAMNKGQVDRTGGWMYPARTLAQQDWNELDSQGFTEPLEVGA